MAEPPALLAATLAADAVPQLAGNDIWSVLPADTPAPAYDGRAKLYDRLIGNRLYNRIAWGTSPAAYADFARRAAQSGDGAFLDAGCGSLVSTAAVHAASGRPTILVDLSLDMLRVARERLVATAGRLPGHLVLLQADIRRLPFRRASFGAVLCPGMLHLFEDVEAIARGLARVTAPAGRVFMTSLVSDRRFGVRYLAALHRAGEVAQPRTAALLVDRLGADASGMALSLPIDVRGNMAFLAAEIPRAAA